MNTAALDAMAEAASAFRNRTEFRFKPDAVQELRLSFDKSSSEVELPNTDLGGKVNGKKKTRVMHRAKFCEQMGLLGQK
jgi:hypothetical protein